MAWINWSPSSSQGGQCLYYVLLSVRFREYRSFPAPNCTEASATQNGVFLTSKIERRGSQLTTGATQGQKKSTGQRRWQQQQQKSDRPLRSTYLRSDVDRGAVELYATTRHGHSRLRQRVKRVFLEWMKVAAESEAAFDEGIPPLTRTHSQPTSLFRSIVYRIQRWVLLQASAFRQKGGERKLKEAEAGARTPTENYTVNGDYTIHGTPS